MSTNKTLTISHLGKTYKGEIATIKNTYLGNGEDSRGVFSSMLFCEWEGSGIGVGGYTFDQYEEASKRRIGTAYGMEFIMAILETAGVSSWEKLKGTKVVVLFDAKEPFSTTWGSEAVGFAGLENDKVFIHKEFSEYWKAREDN